MYSGHFCIHDRHWVGMSIMPSRRIFHNDRGQSMRSMPSGNLHVFPKANIMLQLRRGDILY